MSDLRERFRALDALDVPDVLSRARMIGPKPPEPDPTPPLRRAGALVFAAVVAILAVFLITRALGESEQPADPPTPTPTPSSDTAFRRDGEVITFSGDDPRGGGELVGVDPDTGEVRALVAAPALSRGLLDGFLIGSAAWSADGRWMAFEVVACGGGVTDAGGSGGLWVTNGLDEPRQLTKPCFEEPDVAPYNELWEWSPAGAQLVVARRSADRTSLVLIDAATGDRTDLGAAVGREVSGLAWAPDGTQIAYGTSPGGSVYTVGVPGGDHTLLAASLGYVYGIGNTWVGGSGIQWSPDSAQVLIQAWDFGTPGDGVYIVDRDGSDLRELDKDGEINGISWSPDGSKIAYASVSGEPDGRRTEIWTVSPDGSTPLLIFESATFRDYYAAGSPIWSPDGTLIAFTGLTPDAEMVWLVMNADGTGDAREIDEIQYLSWRGGWYFCHCYG
jgi:Tol biopolymer transport system component